MECSVSLLGGKISKSCSARNLDPQSKDRFEENPDRTTFQSDLGNATPGQQAMPQISLERVGDFAIRLNDHSQSFQNDGDQVHDFARQRFLRLRFL
jgi:hypothetical protein